MWNQPEPDEAGKKKLASSILGKEGDTTGNRPSAAEEDNEPDNSDEEPQKPIERMVLERAHNGYVLSHHYQQPEPRCNPRGDDVARAQANPAQDPRVQAPGGVA